MEKISIVAKIPLSRNLRLPLKFNDSDLLEDSTFLLIKSKDFARKIAYRYAKHLKTKSVHPSSIYSAGIVVSACHMMIKLLVKKHPKALSRIASVLDKKPYEKMLSNFQNDFLGQISFPESQENLLVSWITTTFAQANPAFGEFGQLFTDKNSPISQDIWDKLIKTEEVPFIKILNEPIATAPHSIKDQLLYILHHWMELLGFDYKMLLGALDMVEEEIRHRGIGPGPTTGPGFGEMSDAARYSQDKDWMIKVILIAKNVLVWMDQLSKSYQREIRQLDQIPDEELDVLSSRGLNALWLIGLWERSPASRKIKQYMGNPEAAASAYSILRYEISHEIGGWEALANLKERAWQRGIRLACDMVPNHMGLDSDWLQEHPDWFLGTNHCPFPSYTFHGENLSRYGNTVVQLEDHYWNKSDAAVVFRHINQDTGEARYIYHGNDGTSIPWNDTAQIDFLNQQAREAVMDQIIKIAHNFPIIRFDAAMVITQKQIRRLWYPPPGSGGAIPSRSDNPLNDEEFYHAMPREFWIEVVERAEQETPDTLLLAEAFWQMEGYFVRNLGMHRVYNSAFMNMLKDEKNQEYRDILKEILTFDPNILQRFVNFMNNPDEKTAWKLFGKDDKYFAVCTLLVTMPGLPMIGHGQIEGLTEKYGMEYVKAYRDEHPDGHLIYRHEQEIFPLLFKRHIFSQATNFRLYDLFNYDGVNESVYAFTNFFGNERALVIVNNSHLHAHGMIKNAHATRTSEGNLVYDNLISAFDLHHAHEKDWFLLKDALSNLWFIRSISEIKNEGLKILVAPYGRHIFLEFRLVQDHQNPVWEQLWMELNGAGVPDIDAAINDMIIRPVKTALEQLLPTEAIQKLSKEIHSGQIPSPWIENHIAEWAISTIATHAKIDMKDPQKQLKEIRQALKKAAMFWKKPPTILHKMLDENFQVSEKDAFDESVFVVFWVILSFIPTKLWVKWNMEHWIKNWNKAIASDKICQLLSVFQNYSIEEAIAENLNTTKGTVPQHPRLVVLCAVARSVPQKDLQKILRKWKNLFPDK